MAGHGHSHGGGGCGSHEIAEDFASMFNLYLKIDRDNVVCLNEETEGSGKLVFKPWDQRLEKDKYVESDADDELLLQIPFTGNVKLKAIIIIGGEDATHPKLVKLFKNRPHMSFEEAHTTPDQEFELARDDNGTVQYPLKVAKFSQVRHLSIYIPSSMGAETSKIYYIGLKGDFTPARREEIVIVNYELAPNPADHKASDFNPNQITPSY